MKKLKSLVNKNNLFDWLIYITLIIIVGFLFVSKNKAAEEIYELNTKKDLTDRQLAVFHMDSAIDSLFLFKKVDIKEDSHLCQFISDIKKEKSNNIIVLTDGNGCKPCYSTIINKCLTIFNSKSLLEYCNIYLLLQSKNINYAKSIVAKLDGRINLLVDTTMQFTKKYQKTNTNFGVILVLDKYNICHYAKAFDKSIEYDFDNIISLAGKFIQVNERLLR